MASNPIDAHTFDTFEVAQERSKEVSQDIRLSDDQNVVYKQMLEWARNPSDVRTLGGYAGTGKGQPYGAKVMTPFGEKDMGSLKVGSLVSNPDGSVARVIGVYELGVRDIYRVTFSDGASTRVTLDHLWLVKRAGKHLKAERRDMNGSPLWGRVETTEVLKKYIDKENARGDRAFLPLVPLTKPVVMTMWNRSKAPLDPYILGALLGDGGLTQKTPLLSTNDREIVDIFTRTLGCELRTSDGTSYRIPQGSGVKQALVELGVYGKYSFEKEIPRRYTHGTRAERLALVQGLMDTDGTVDLQGGVSFTTTSKIMAEQVRWVLFTLGFRVTMTCRIPTFNSKGENREGREAYTLFIQGENSSRLFRLSRKVERCLPDFNGGVSTPARRMVSIELDGREQARCIAVDHPNSLYLTDDCIVTHNTTLLAKLIQDLGEDRFVCATFTGRAANVLAQKIGVSSVQTIHRTIYRPAESKNGVTRFELRTDAVFGDKIFVIDEASMVSEDLLYDIKALGLPILAVGDHGQLPPIEGFSVLMDNPTWRLEKIHRQAEGSPIIALSRLIREKGRVPIPPPAGIRFLSWGAFKEEMAEKLSRADEGDLHDQVVLTYKNATRVKVNQLVREARFGEASNQEPRVGDMVVCLRNMPPVFNGMRGTLRGVGKPYKFGVNLEIAYPDDGILHSGPVVLAQFGRETTFSSLEDLRKEKIFVGNDVRAAGAFYDYGYALTVHKAQGSGFKKVYWIRERGRGTEEDFMKWCYTAVTRASEELTIVAV